MENREWARELADDYESRGLEWGSGFMVRRTQTDSLCFCLLGGIARQAGVVIEFNEFGPFMNAYGLLENEIYSERSASLGGFLSAVDSWEITNDQRRDAVVNYNDHDGRTKEQIIEKLREYANEE